MANNIRNSGIDVIGDVPWGTHFCQFYKTKQDLIDILVPYFRAGLNDNEFCMWVTSEPLMVAEAQSAMINADGDFNQYLQRGQIEIIPYNEWYLLGGTFEDDRVLQAWVDKLEQVLKQGYDGLRLTGNTLWLERNHWQPFTEYEAKINNVVGKYNMLAACTYCLDKCDATAVIDVVKNHQFALIKQEGKWDIIESAVYKQAKEKINHLASFPELNPNPIMELGEDGIIRYINSAAGTFFPDIRTAGKEHPVLAGWDGLVEALRKEKTHIVVRDVQVGGTWYEQAVVYVPSGHTIRLYCRDITERKRLDNLKDEFIGLVSHELRTPLTVINGGLSTLITEWDNLSSSEVQLLLHDALLESASLSHLVENLLELSRSQALQLSLYLETTDLRKLVKATIARLKQSYPQRRVLTSIPPNLQPITADPLRIERILYNLMENAAKYSAPSSQIKLTVDRQPERLVIGVHDRGKGLSASEIARIFRPFQRLAGKSTRRTRGAGLGLMVCQRLVEAHGGRIWVESKKGEGSTFFFDLPLQASAPAAGARG